MANFPALMTIAETADVFGVSKESVRRWVEDERLPAIRTPSGRIRIRRADVEAFLPPEIEPAQTA